MSEWISICVFYLHDFISFFYWVFILISKSCCAVVCCQVCVLQMSNNCSYVQVRSQHAEVPCYVAIGICFNVSITDVIWRGIFIMLICVVYRYQGLERRKSSASSKHFTPLSKNRKRVSHQGIVRFPLPIKAAAVAVALGEMAHKPALMYPLRISPMRPNQQQLIRNPLRTLTVRIQCSV